MKTTTNEKYHVVVTLAPGTPGQHKPYILTKKFPDPREARDAVYRYTTDTAWSRGMNPSNFIIEEKGERPFLSIFVEKWKKNIWKSVLFRRFFPVALILLGLTTVAGIIAAYVGGNPRDIWDTGYLFTFALMVLSVSEVLVKSLKDTSNYAGAKEYMDFE